MQGGVERHCEQLCPKLAKAGCNVTVLTRTPYIEKEKRISEWCGVKLMHLWAPHRKTIEAFIHTLIGTIIARIKSPHLVHYHAIGPSLLIPLAKFLGLRVVMTHHGPDYKRDKWGKCAKFFLKLGEMLGVRLAESVIVVSKTARELLVKRYKREDLIFIPNGVDMPVGPVSSDLLKKYNLKSKRYILTVSRFVPEKGLHDLVKAYAKVTNPGFRLVIVGDADHETSYSKSLKAMVKNTKGVILTGRLTRMQLPELYTHAKLFVLPSYYEGLPITLLEAMSYGLTLLVSDIPAHREIPLAAHCYFPVGNVRVLSKQIIELYNRKLSRKEHEIYRKSLLKIYNWDIIVNRTMSVYQQIIKHNRKIVY